MTTTPIAPSPGVGSGSDQAVADRPTAVALAPQVGEVLLHLAQAVVAATASGHLREADLRSLMPAVAPAGLDSPAAAFVTLHEDDVLRGCVGCLAADEPLWQTVMTAAVGAASRDPRFLPVTVQDVPYLTIDVSVLGPRVPLRDPAAFRPGLDGVLVERGDRRGLLLPEVATEQGWGAVEMLETTCRKAGLPRDAWRDPGTDVFVFRTARTSEAETAV